MSTTPRFHYLKNLRQSAISTFADPLKISASVPSNIKAKTAFRDYCANPNTSYVFYNLAEGDNPNERITAENPVRILHGFVADYDAPPHNATYTELASGLLKKMCPSHAPTWLSKTFSGYVRMIWEFEEPLPLEPQLSNMFMSDLADMLRAKKLMPGFDATSLQPSQYFAFGSDWAKIGEKVPAKDVHTVLLTAANKVTIQVKATNIPIEDVAKEVEKRFGERWTGPFEVGARGPLFWIDDGIGREGCQVREDGMICYSDRAGKGFVSWGEIFGAKWVATYEKEKMDALFDSFWFNGKVYYKLLNNNPVIIPKEQLILELRKIGFKMRPKKGASLSEVEEALLNVSNQCRVDEIAPVIFSGDRVVNYNGHKILNTCNTRPIHPANIGNKSHWPFLHNFIFNLFAPSRDGADTTPYFLSWFQRFYNTVRFYQTNQGQLFIIIGPAGRGKTLLNNRIIGAAVGGFADASSYLSGATQFNKDLAGAAAWVVDDAIAASTWSDQRKFVELSKRAVANPRMEYMAKYADAISIPWTGRVLISLNTDANSLAALPTLDCSNRDKVMALRINSNQVSFGPNQQVEETIAEELPYFLHWLVEDFKIPDNIKDSSRFGIKSYIDPTIEAAAYDNSSRSAIGEMVDLFAKRIRNSVDGGLKNWRGTLTEFQVLLHEANGGRSVGESNKLEFVRRGMTVLEENCHYNSELRPVKSIGSGGGNIWEIDLSEAYDLDNQITINGKELNGQEQKESMPIHTGENR